MKSLITVLYFTLMLFLVAFLFRDLGYKYDEALFISATFLPTIVLAHQLSNGFRFKKNENIFALISFIIGVFILQLLLITLANYILGKFFYLFGYLEANEDEMPDITINPIWIFMVFMLYYLPYRFIIERIFKNSDEIRKVEFVPNRKRITLFVSDIIYVESCDTEVWLYTKEDKFKSKTNISSWERELGESFVRVHRSYLVNKNSVCSLETAQLTLNDGREIPISRSYKDRIFNK